MARAKKCDKCGEYYQTGCDGTGVILMVRDGTYRTADLCSSCQEQLAKIVEEWWPGRLGTFKKVS
jgi:hypothetical protein